MEGSVPLLGDGLVAKESARACELMGLGSGHVWVKRYLVHGIRSLLGNSQKKVCTGSFSQLIASMLHSSFNHLVITSMKSISNVDRSAPRFRPVALTPTIVLSAAVLSLSVFFGSAMAAMLAPKEGEEAGPKDWPVNPAKHEIVIKRVATDDKQAAMITAAEMAQAPREALLKESKAQDPNADGNQAALPEGDKVWWYQEKLGTRIPYAITRDAIIYYSDIVATNAKKAFKSYAEPSTHLEYQASVQFHKEFKLDDKTFSDVNVVTLKLSFAANFTAEATSGLSFEKTRVVVLDAGNKVLHLSGDGPTEAMIMML